MTDAEGRLTFYNEAAAELWGCHPELGESKFCGSWRLYWPDGTPLPHDECPMAIALRQRRPIRGMEAVAERPDGTRVSFVPYPTPLFDESGRLTGAVNMLVDISERRQAEYDKQRLAAIIDSSDDAIVGKDLNGIVTSWNLGAERLFGYSAEEMIGKSITLLIPAHLRHEETRILERIARGERIEHFETTRVRKDGTFVSISLSVSPVRNTRGSLIGASKIARDITKRKDAELALADRNTQLRLAGKTGLVGSYVFDLNTGRVKISAGYVAIYGLPDGTEEYGRDEWQARVHPDDLARLDALRTEALAERRPEHRSEYRILRPDGEVRWVESRASILYDDDGRAERMVGVNIDVTERKRLEEQQRVLVAELDHRVKNVLTSVSAVVSQTLEASRASDDLAVALNGRLKSMGVAHELLNSNRWVGISLAEIVRRELAPYATSKNTEINGPEIMLTASAGQTMAIVFHELVTNAAKYGALSTQEGRVLVRWNRHPDEDPRGAHLVVEWQETDGPSVDALGKPGHGTSAIREQIPFELDGSVDFALNRDGVRCRMEIPGDCLTG